MIAAQQAHAPLSSGASWGKQSLSALSSRLTAFVSRTLNGTAPTGGTCYEEVCLSSMSTFAMSKERSQSRGRDAFASTGRGGLGNIRQTSLTRAEGTPSSPAAELIRGREPGNALPATSKLYSTGRGGAGNIRSPSRSYKRDPSQPPTLPAVFDASKQDIIRNHIYVTEEAPISTGRGGVGNIQSRSQSRGPGLDLNNPNPNSTASPKASLPKDPPPNESSIRPVRGQSDANTTRDLAKDTSAATAGDGRFTYPPTYQAADPEGED